MFYPYSSGYHIPSSPSFPGAWSSAWSLPQQHLKYEAEVKRVDNSRQSLSSDSVDLDGPEPTGTSIHKPVSRSKADPSGALFTSCQQEIPYLSLSQSSLTSSQDDPVSDSNTLPEYSRPYSPKLTALASESNNSLDTLSLFSANSFMNSSNSTLSQNFSSEIEHSNQDTSHSCNSHRKSTETAPPTFDNNALGDHDTFLDHIPRVSNTGRDYSEFYPYPLLLSEPDGNTWTLSLDPTNSHLISRSSLELESSHASDHDDEVIASTRLTFPSVPLTPKYNGSFLSLPRSQVGVHDIAKYTPASDVSMIVSSSSSVQQRHGRATISNTGKDLYSNDLLHDFPLSTAQDSVLDPQQRSGSKTLIKTSKNVFGRLKKLFTPKRTISENVHHPPKSDFVAANPRVASGRRFFSSYQRTKLTKSAQFSTPSLAHSFSPGDTSLVDVNEKYTYEYHARPKTLKEIKSQRRFSLPLAFVGTSSRATPPPKL